MTEDAVDQTSVMKALDWAYDTAIRGVAGLDSASEMADSYKKQGTSPRQQADSLIRWQNTKAATSGFVSGLGGILTMPVTVPANVASVLYVQIRMIAAIAHLGGHDIRDDRVRTLVLACMTGNAAKDIVKEAGIIIGKEFATAAIQRISRETIIAINKRVGFRLLTKFGKKGAINLGKAVPVVGGVLGATLDALATNVIGNIARNTFIAEPNERA